VNNLVMSLRILSYNFYKLRKIVPIQYSAVYLALYQSIIQYGLLIWGGLEGSTMTNFKLFNVPTSGFITEKPSDMCNH